EVCVLRGYKDRGAVRVLDVDEEWGVALLEGAEPGKPLSTIEDDERATNIFCEVFRRFHHYAPPDGRYPSIQQHFAAIKRYRERFDDVNNAAPLPESWVENAEECLEYLIRTTKENVLLHGDLHHDKILLRGKEQ